jgi:hypothetical protein
MSAPEGEVTAAVMRTARALHDVAAKEGLVSPGGFGIDWDTSDAFVADARKALDAALDVEEMTRAISSHRHGSEVPWPEDLRTAEALRAAILGGAA